jgi:hypothetical protein
MFSVGWFLGLDGTACLVWQAPPGDEKTPTGGRRWCARHGLYLVR